MTDEGAKFCQNCGKPLPKGAAACPACGAAIPRTGSLPAPPKDGQAAPVSLPPISGYLVKRFVAEGGMGAVYEAEEKNLGRRVAIKMVSEKFLQEEGANARFMREAKTMATVEHQNIVRVYAYGEHEGKPYLAMEFVEGEVLAERIRREGALPVDEALRLTRQVVEALEAAWEKGIVHRDIKPSNILLDRKGRVRVADFGLAKPAVRSTADATLTGAGLVLGTPHYASPEQARGQHVDFRSDVYSLGIVLYELLTGSRPFEGTTPFAVVEKHVSAPLPSLREKRHDAPIEVQGLVEWMTQKEQSKRPSSYAELLGALDALTGFSPSTPLPMAPTMQIPVSHPSLAGKPPTHPPASAATIPTHASERPVRDWKKIGMDAASVAVLAALLAWFGWGLWRYYFKPEDARTDAALDEKRLVVAVTPFYGPDEDSIKEGKSMAFLIERAISERMPQEDVKILGLEETKTPVRGHDAARALGASLGANAVIWGEALALRGGETEFRPFFTMTPKAKKKEEAPEKEGKKMGLSLGMPKVFRTQERLPWAEEQAAKTLSLEAAAPNQIELRQTSAAGVGDMVFFLAGLHALHNQSDPMKALRFFEKAPRTAESLRWRATALLALGEKDAALSAVRQGIALDPRDAASHALLGDALMLQWGESKP